MLKSKKCYQICEFLKRLGLICALATGSSLVTRYLTTAPRLAQLIQRSISKTFGTTGFDRLSASSAVGSLNSDQADSISTISPSSRGIQAAIDSLPSSGGTIELTPGTYTFSSPISVRSNLTIEGSRSAILAPTANFGAFVNSGSVSNVIFRGFTLNTSGIALANADHIVVQNVAFLNTGSTAVAFMDPVNHIQILDNDCESPATYFCFSLGASASPNPQDHDWIIRGNTMENCAGNCIIAISGTRIVIADNVINGCGDTCIEVGTGTSLATVTGNVVDTSSSSTAVHLVGISTRSSKNSVVTGNSVRGNASDSGGACYLAWHGGETGETQLEENNIYIGNVSVGCPIGFKAANASDFLVGAFDFDQNERSVDIDKDSKDWILLRSLHHSPRH